MILDAQQVVRNILLDRFLNIQKKNPRFSIRAYGRKLGISSAALSEILRGKRKVSHDKALGIAEKLKLKTKIKKGEATNFF